MLFAIATAADAADRRPDLAAAAETVGFFPVRVAWSAAFGVAPASPPVADAERLFVALRNGRVVALSMDRNAYLWNIALEARGPIAADGTRVFVPSADAIEALDAATGAAVWRSPLPAGPVVGITATSGWLFVTLDAGPVQALRADTGARVWERALAMPAHVSPLLHGNDLIVGTTAGDVVALGTVDGEPRWSTRVDGASTGFGVREGRLYFGTDAKQFYCLRAGDGFIEWRWRIGATIVGEPGFDRRHVYVVGLDNQVRALDLRTGAQRWRKPLPARPIGSALSLGTGVIVPCIAAELRGLASRDGASQGRYPMDAELGTMPVIVGRPLSRGGDVLVLVLSDGSTLGLQRRVEPAFAGLSVLPGVPVPVTPALPLPASPPPPR